MSDPSIQVLAKSSEEISGTNTFTAADPGMLNIVIIELAFERPFRTAAAFEFLLPQSSVAWSPGKQTQISGAFGIKSFTVSRSAAGGLKLTVELANHSRAAPFDTFGRFTITPVNHRSIKLAKGLAVFINLEPW